MQSCPVTSHRGKFSTLNRPITNQYFFSHRRHLVLANNNPCKSRVFIIFRSNSKAIYVTLSAYVYRTADWSVLNGERNVFLVRKGKYSVVVLAAVAPWGFIWISSVCDLQKLSSQNWLFTTRTNTNINYWRKKWKTASQITLFHPQKCKARQLLSEKTEIAAQYLG